VSWSFHTETFPAITRCFMYLRHHNCMKTYLTVDHNAGLVMLPLRASSEITGATRMAPGRLHSSARLTDVTVLLLVNK